MRRMLAWIVVIAMAILAIPLTTRAPAHAATNYTIGQFNMAGGHEDHGKDRYKPPDALVESVKDRKPAWMTLQESCADWNETLKSKLPEYDVAFQAVKERKYGPDETCAKRSAFGNSILFRKGLGFEPPERKQRHDLESPPGKEQREMLCIKAPTKGVAVCTIHLTHDDVQARRHQATVARKILDKDYAGYRVFLGGDLNDDPMSAVADNFYHRDYGSGAHGRYKEVDSPCGNRIREKDQPPPSPFLRLPPRCRSGSWTGGIQKIDYIFVPTSVKIRWATVGKAKHSDHKLLWTGVSV